MIEYKGYFITGTALMIHPNSPDRRALGTVFAKTSHGSIVEVDHIGGPVFMTKEAAEEHGLTLCQAWIEEKTRKDTLHFKAAMENPRAITTNISELTSLS